LRILPLLSSCNVGSRGLGNIEASRYTSSLISLGRIMSRGSLPVPSVVGAVVSVFPLLFPTDAWLSRQVTEAFPWDTAPRYLLRDRDASYGAYFFSRVEAMGITQVVTAPRLPWRNARVEQVIGSIRRECLDHIVIFNERHLRRVLPSYVDYYHRTRTHLSLYKDCPDPRPIMPA
jgi:hypothetical protein